MAGVDLLPTICKFAGVDVPADYAMDRDSMSDVLLGKTRARTPPLMWEWRFRIFGEPFHRSPMLAIRDGDWSLLMNHDRTRSKLNDIPRDPTR